MEKELDITTEELYNYIARYNNINKFINNKLILLDLKIIDHNDPVKNFN